MKLLLIFYALIFSLNLTAQPIILLEEDDTGVLGMKTYVYEDLSKKLTIEDVMRKTGLFAPCDKDVYLAPKRPNAVWIKFEVKNLTDKHYCIVVDNPDIDELDVYQANNSSVKQIAETGDMRPFSARQIKRNNFIIPVNLIKEKTYTFYIRYTCIIRPEIPISFQTFSRIIKNQSMIDLWYGIFYGMFIIAIIFNLFIYLVVGEISYLLYIAYIFFFVIYRAGMLGHLYQFFIPNHPVLNQHIPFISVPVAAIFMIKFGTSFLRTRLYAPRLLKWSFVFLIGNVMVVIISFIEKDISAHVMSLILLFTSIYMFTIGFFSYEQGYVPARYYLLAFICFFIGFIVATIWPYGIIPYSFLTVNILNIGIALEAIFLSFALGDLYNVVKKEKEEAQHELTIELESKIVERNKVEEEQRNLNDNLVKTNIDLDNFIYTASHDLKVPIMNIEGLIDILENEKNEGDRRNILNMMKTSVTLFDNIVNSLTEISKVQKISEIDLEKNIVKKVINRIMVDLSDTLIRAKGEIKMDLDACPEIYFSRTNFRRVLENLLLNAVQFRSPDRNLRIDIKSWKTEIFDVISIEDNGLGINLHNQEKVFSIFKKAHNQGSGRGIGLYLVKRILENSGGHIKFESKEGKGSTFILYFKRASKS